MCASGPRGGFSRDGLYVFSQDEWALRIVGRLGADVLDPPFPFRTEEVESEAVMVWVGFGDQACAEGHPLGGIHQALEDGVLHPLAAIFAQAGHPAQAAFSFLIAGAHVIADQDQHRGSSLPPKKSRVTIKTAADTSGE